MMMNREERSADPKRFGMSKSHQAELSTRVAGLCIVSSIRAVIMGLSAGISSLYPRLIWIALQSTVYDWTNVEFILDNDKARMRKKKH